MYGGLSASLNHGEAPLVDEAQLIEVSQLPVTTGGSAFRVQITLNNIATFGAYIICYYAHINPRGWCYFTTWNVQL
jgi:hypothetical protein